MSVGDARKRVNQVLSQSLPNAVAASSEFLPLQVLSEHELRPYMSIMHGVESTPIYINPQANRIIKIDGGYCAYEQLYRRRRSLGLLVGIKGLKVSVPYRVSQETVDRFLQEKAAWIIQKIHLQINRQQTQQSTRICWEHGGHVTYMGNLFEIHLKPESEGMDVDLVCIAQKHSTSPSFFKVAYVNKKADSRIISQAMQEWMKQRALTYFMARCQYFGNLLGVAPSQVVLTNARTRWGSANIRGVIRLHWRLIQMPQTLVDYVVVHELAHLKEMNHSARFWRIVEHILPNYQDLRQQLKKQVLPLW